MAGPKQKYTLVSIAELDADPPQLPPTLWGGDACWIVHPSFVLIDGDTKVGKSLLAMQFGEALLDSAQDTWCGAPVGQVGKVLYLNAEVSQPFVLVRARKMWQERVASLSGLVTVQERGLRLDRDDGFLDSVVRDSGAEVAIIDPWDRFHNADPNSTQEMGKLLMQVSGVIDRRGVTIVIVHHWNKGVNKDGRSNFIRARGSTRMPGDADSHFAISRAQPRGAILVQAQLRHGEWNKDLTLHRDPDTLIFAPPTAQASKDALPPRVKATLGLVAVGKNRLSVVKELHTILSMSQAKAEATIDEALAQGLLRSGAKGELYAVEDSAGPAQDGK